MKITLAKDALAPVWEAVRRRRDLLLSQSDWTQLSDVPLTGQERAAWAAYRRALRDLPSTGSPDAIVWPQPPAPVTARK